MELSLLKDEDLLEKTTSLAQEEREKLSTILLHLREVDRRKLFSGLGFKSIFEFAVKSLGYSEDQAYRRVNAMRLLAEVPEVEKDLRRGLLTLSHLNLAQNFFRQEKKVRGEGLSLDQKKAVLQQMLRTTAREAQRVILSWSSEPVTLAKDRIRAVGPEHVEFIFTGRSSLETKVTTLKAWLAHTNPDLSLGELFEMLCDLALVEWDPSQTATSKKGRVKSLRGVRREVFRRAENRCQSCGSQYALEVDHVYPRAWGGGDEPENLRLLCRSCNLRASIKLMGEKAGEWKNPSQAKGVSAET